METTTKDLAINFFLLGRNRNRESDVVVYLRYGKHMNKRKYSIHNNRYERHLNKLRSTAWNVMTKESWYNELDEFDKVINDDDDNEPINVNIDLNITASLNGIHETDNNKANEIVSEPIHETNNSDEIYETNKADEGKEFPNKRDLYDYYGIDINTIPDGYEVTVRYSKVSGKMGRLNKLMKK